MMLFLILFSAVWVYYSLYSLRGFYIKIHQQVYQDYSEIISESLSFNNFIKKSSLMSFEFVTYQIFLSYLIILLPILLLNAK